jgi:addiction module RelB/DinJ family antitoxin
MNMSKSVVVKARMERELKDDVKQILKKLGLTSSKTVNLLYRQIQLRRGLPFEVQMDRPAISQVKRNRAKKLTT